MNPLTNEAVTLNVEVGWPPDNTTLTTIYRVTILGAFSNGTAYNYVVEAENTKIIERTDKSMEAKFFGQNEYGFSGSSLLKPRPIYEVTINAPEMGIIGSITLRGNVCISSLSFGEYNIPHY